MIRAIDHLVILVSELDQAIADYSALGFTVVRGGEHPGAGSHNALIAFADGTYLELIAFFRPNDEHPWWRMGQRAGEGLVDYALLPGDTAADIAAARARGLDISGPTPGGRLRPDGNRVEWDIGRPAAAALPFLCGDRTPRSLRVPEGAARRHPNGALGIAGLTVAVADLAAAVEEYGALLGGGALAAPPAVVAGLGISAAALRLDSALITLVSPH
ncbi:MAG TPA: VOC family protein, partial [Herpetosiphonaceae bacterium]|nr:VOC family protein [Herpetosiphonaceae bacterium]